jgi:hypothetical protein
MTFVEDMMITFTSLGILEECSDGDEPSWGLAWKKRCHKDTVNKLP